MNIFFENFDLIMKYILINDIQRISKEIHMPQNEIIFYVPM